MQAGQARALAAAHTIQRGAAVVEADENELVYEITSNCLSERTTTTHPFPSLI